MNDRELETFFKSPHANAFDSSSPLSGNMLEHNQDIFGDSLSNEPLGMPSFEDLFRSILQERGQGAEGGEFEEEASIDQDSTSGFLAPTDFSIDQVVAHFPGLDTALETGARLFDTSSTLVEQSVESGSLLAKNKIQVLSDSARALLQDAVESWNDPDNSVHNALNHKLDETVDEVSELADSVGRSQWWARVKQRIDTAVDATSSFTERLSESLGYGVSNSDISKEETALASATSRLADNLMDLTQDPDFGAKLETAFGDDVDSEKAEELIHGLAQGESGPEIVVIDQENLQGEGAFGDNKIFVSDELVAESIDSPEVIDRVLLEEVGHYLDQELNDVDSPGDEGEIFARLTKVDILSANELQRLQHEDDHSTLVFENASINIENSELSAEERSQEIARLEAQAQQLSTASPYASQAMYQEATDLREIARLEEDSQKLATASPYASQAMNEEAKQLREETYFYSNADQSDTLLSYSSSGSMLTGQRVEQWQQDLKDLGYEIDVDGDFGPQTDAITKQFQQDNGLVVDGIVGPKTLAALESVSSQAAITPKIPKVSDEQKSSETTQTSEQLSNEIESLDEQIDNLGTTSYPVTKALQDERVALEKELDVLELEGQVESLNDQIDNFGTTSSSVTQALRDELAPLELKLEKIELEETIDNLGTTSSSVTQALRDELNATETELERPEQVENDIKALEQRKEDLIEETAREDGAPPPMIDGSVANQRASEISRIEEQIAALKVSLDTPPPEKPDPSEVIDTQIQELEESKAELEKKLESFKYRRYRGSIIKDIKEIEEELARYEAGYRPLLTLPSVSNEESRQFHADVAGIDRELLDTTIEHEGGNFHSRWRGPFIRPIQEGLNDLNDIGVPLADTSVGYAQIQPRNAVEIGRDIFGLDLTEEKAREMLTSNDEFSNAIAAEFLAQRAERIDPEHRSNRTIFTSYAASPKTIEQFNDIDWDFDRARELVASGDLAESTFNDLYNRYYTLYPNAAFN